MKSHRRAAIHSLAILAVAAVAGAVLLAVVGRAVLQGAAKRSEDRKAEQQSMRDFGKAAKGVLDGKGLGAKPNFPDTEIGRMQRISFEWVQSEQERQQRLEAAMAKAGWDWVGTPESMRSNANLQQCLDRCAKVKQLVNQHHQDLRDGLQAVIVKMRAEGSDSRDGREFLAGMEESLVRPDSGFLLGLKTWEILVKNIEALEDSYRFLMARSGKYKIDELGAVQFNDSVPKGDRQQYDLIVDRINRHLEEIQRIEALRMKMAKEKLGELERFGTKG